MRAAQRRSPRGNGSPGLLVKTEAAPQDPVGQSRPRGQPVVVWTLGSPDLRKSRGIGQFGADRHEAFVHRGAVRHHLGHHAQAGRDGYRELHRLEIEEEVRRWQRARASVRRPLRSNTRLAFKERTFDWKCRSCFSLPLSSSTILSSMSSAWPVRLVAGREGRHSSSPLRGRLGRGSRQGSGSSPMFSSSPRECT